MAARGRPAKILTSNDLMTLQQFLEKLPFLKKNQQQALTLLQQANGIFNDKQLSLLKTADRDKNLFLKRQTLIEQCRKRWLRHAADSGHSDSYNGKYDDDEEDNSE